MPSSSSPPFDQPISTFNCLISLTFSLYNSFITGFPSTLFALNDLVIPSTTHPNPLYDSWFTDFFSTQEADPRCGKLKLRDWLLTAVQRWPRHLLLLKELSGCTDEDDLELPLFRPTSWWIRTFITIPSYAFPEYISTRTLSLLTVQRATPSLPLKLISPGRRLLNFVGPCIKLKEVRISCNANSFFPPIVSYMACLRRIIS